MSRKVKFVSDAAKKEFEKLRLDIREDFSKSIGLLLKKEKPTCSKSLKNLGKNIKGVNELRINGSPAYRLVYTIKDNTVYILHSFVKTTNGSDNKAMDVVVKRFKDLPQKILKEDMELKSKSIKKSESEEIP